MTESEKKQLTDLAASIRADANAIDAIVAASNPPLPPKTLEQLIADAPAGSTINLTGNYMQAGPIKIDKNLKIVGVNVGIEYSGTIDTGLFTCTSKVTAFALHGVIVSGGKANYVVRSDNAKGIVVKNVKTFKDPDTGLGCGMFFASGVDGVLLDDCQTEFTTVYSMYTSGNETLQNKNITLRRCKWGKTDSHCMRTYGVKNMLIEDCTMSNPKSESGRQAIKVMNGENITIRRTLFDGTTRFGRDVNDPPTYKLANVLLEDCNFKDWTRTDSDNVTYRNAVVVADDSGFCFHLTAKTVLENVAATYIGGKFASNPAFITSKKNCTFNGVAV